MIHPKPIFYLLKGDYMPKVDAEILKVILPQTFLPKTA